LPDNSPRMKKEIIIPFKNNPYSNHC